VELWSYYGHREAAFCSALRRLAGDDNGGALGRAMVGARLHLLDQQLRPVPPGEEGRIYIGGPSVARGYLDGDPSGSQRFLPDPFSTDGRGVLFRTGDLATRREDGSIALVRPSNV
jgi:non-ribosomal peptide synthetase component F